MVNKRLLSIDALRGFDMVWILGLDGLFIALYQATGWALFQSLDKQMHHSLWHGITAYDLIFPLFIFLSGITIGLTQNNPAKPCAHFSHKKALKRVFLLIALGIIYNHGWGQGIPTNIEQIRFTSVLARIAIAWYIALLCAHYLTHRMQVVVCIGILIIYYLLLEFVQLGNFGSGDYSSTGALNRWFDQQLLPGRTYHNALIDPEGLLSNLPAISHALIGVFAGRILKQQPPYRAIIYLITLSVICLFCGYLWAFLMPINKTLWTSSFTLVGCGFCLLLTVLFFYFIDVLNWHRLGRFFAIIGLNSIMAYLASSLIDWSYINFSLFGGVLNFLATDYKQIAEVLTLILIQWLALFVLYKHKLFFKV